MRFTAKIEGLDRLLKKIEQYTQDVRQNISAALHESAQNIAEAAAADAPVDQSILRGTISVKTIDDLNYEVVSPADYSAFIEFGTKTKVQIPPGLEKVAEAYKGQRGASAEGARKMIYAWCKRVGIPEDGWYPVYRSIMVNGIKPRPFFFKQVAIEKPNLIKNVKKAIRNKY